MKFSTRARYGLRMMVELTRALKTENLVHLGQIAKVTGISVNYLAQLAIPLKHTGLLHGVSGKKGGYMLGRPPEQISVSEVLQAVQGSTGLTDCVDSPDICLNSPFCEARMVWVIASHGLRETFEGVTLADMVSSEWREETRRKYAHIQDLDPDGVMAAAAGNNTESKSTSR